MRDAFKKWMDTGMSIRFVETRDLDDAEVVVSFTQGEGSYSYVGRDILEVKSQRDQTMNIGWDPTTPEVSESAPSASSCCINNHDIVNLAASR